MYPGGQNILVVDHDPRRRQAIEAILADEGFAVTAVSAGLAALRAVNTKRFELIIAAAGLPGTLDGVITVRQARARQPWLKALLTDDGSGVGAGGDRHRDEVIAVPFHRRELLGCVFGLLQRELLAGNAALARRCRAELIGA